uniref:Uncharacterized protein n=1 Tax=Marseillevirus LCMAC202 TaxID=2506606 RepID=A0A481YZM3_9VIRU|nr:MAG: hypothetical protein LCMAC202_06470 [Marseillevirus LCMAC202]
MILPSLSKKSRIISVCSIITKNFNQSRFHNIVFFINKKYNSLLGRIAGGKVMRYVLIQTCVTMPLKERGPH